jgi:release factor glutamine methyltransferase
MNETELLFTEVLGCSRAELYLEKKRMLSRENFSRISGVLKRRISGEPIQYILGKTEFMGLEFKVTPTVLIPRPDTEILVETALRYAVDKVSSEKATGLQVLDIGTGSGCIAVSLAKYLPQAQISATDISPAALEIARQNSKLNGVEKRINFLNCDLFPSGKQRAMGYDLILSNPPYIKTDVIKTLELEVLHEPSIALDGGDDGLDFYRRIIQKAPVYLKPGGMLILEIGFDQKIALEKILRISQIFEVKELVKDYNNINRVIVAGLKEMYG